MPQGSADSEPMGDYVYCRFSDELAARMDLPAIILPVRRENADRLLQPPDGRLALDRLLDELIAYLTEFPDRRAAFSPAGGALAYLAGLELGREGAHAQAAEYLRFGVVLQPANVSLRTNLALALFADQRPKEALEQLEPVLERLDPDQAPHLWLLAARLLHETGRDRRALRMLEACEPRLPAAGGYWELLAAVRRRLGEEPEPFATDEELAAVLAAPGEEPEEHREERRQTPPPQQATTEAPASGSASATAPPELRFCFHCGGKLRAGLKFCPGCGTDLRRVGPPPGDDR